MKHIKHVFFILLCLSLIACNKKVADGAGPKIYDLTGREFLFGDQKNKYIIVNYWASWCAPCKQEIPILTQFYQAHHDEVAVVGVNLDSLDKTTLNKLVSELGINYSIILDDPFLKLRIDQPQVYPTTVFINKQGVVERVYKGVVTSFMLEDFIAHDN